jgi:hypothetical protein
MDALMGWTEDGGFDLESSLDVTDFIESTPEIRRAVQEELDETGEIAAYITERNSELENVA